MSKRTSSREYQQVYQSSRTVEWRRRIEAYLSTHPCVDCGSTESLEFDHVRGEKIGEIGKMVNRRRSWPVIEAEIAKCDVRCTPCHRARHRFRTDGMKVTVPVRKSLVLEGKLEDPWNGCDCHTSIVEVDGVNLAYSLGDLMGRRVRLTVEVLDADPA